MKGVILCGGEGTRLRPMTYATNKHMLRIGKYPMVEYALMKLIDAHINNIHVVTGGENYQGLVKYLGSGSRWNIRITYSIQDEAGGIAQALGLAEPFIDGDKCVVILGDNLFEMPLNKQIEEFKASEEEVECYLFKYPSDTPERFGVLVYDSNQIPCDIIEKPKDPPSKMILTGIYMYTSNVFKIIKTLDKSDRGEFEITDVNRYYLKHNFAKVHSVYGKWTDCGTFETLEIAERLMVEKKGA